MLQNLNRVLDERPDGATHFRLYELRPGRGRPKQTRDQDGNCELDAEVVYEDCPKGCGLRVEFIRREGTGWVSVGEPVVIPMTEESAPPPASATTTGNVVTPPAGGETEATRALRESMKQNALLVGLLMERANEDRADARRERDLRETQQKEHERAWAEAAAESDGSAVTSEVIGAVLGNKEILSSIISFFSKQVPSAGA